MTDIVSKGNSSHHPISKLIPVKSLSGANGDIFVDINSHLIKRVDKYETFSMENYIRDSSLQEVVFLSQYSHPNISSSKKIHTDEKYIYIFMSCDKTSLYNYIADTTAEERIVNVNTIISQLISAIYFLHKNKKIHGDIKPSNIAINKKTLETCLIDFGSMCSFRPTKEYHKRCTFVFSSPESLKPGYKLDYSLDIWSLGMTIIYFYTKAYCYNSKDNNDYASINTYFDKLRENLTETHFPLTVITQKKIHPHILEVLKRMVSYDPTKRITIDELYNDKYFTPNKITKGNFICDTVYTVTYHKKDTNIDIIESRQKIIIWIFNFLKVRSMETSCCLAISIFDRYLNLPDTTFNYDNISLIGICSMILASLLLEKVGISFELALITLKMDPDLVKFITLQNIKDNCNNMITSLSYKLYVDTIDWIVYQRDNTIDYEIILNIICDFTKIGLSDKDLIAEYDTIKMKKKVV